MSADAKIWCEEGTSGWVGWRGIHDETENDTCWAHRQGASLMDTLTAIEKCAGKQLRWEFRTYPDGLIGLVGYHS